MRIATEVSTRPIEGSTDTSPPASEILVDDTPTGAVVGGAFLEAAIRCNEVFLLFMTDDTPFEEFLSIHLLDGHWQLLDSARLGAAYSTGSFSALRLTPPDSVRFRFIGDTDWTVEMLRRPGFRLPFVGDAPGVSRAIGFSRHFIVRGNPAPERRGPGGKASSCE